MTGATIGPRQLHPGGSIFRKDQGFFQVRDFLFPRNDHLHNPALGLPFCLNSSLGIDFQSAPTVRVPHEFLHDFHVLSICHQDRGKRVAESVPADMLPNSSTRCGRTEDTGKQAIRLVITESAIDALCPSTCYYRSPLKP